MRYHGTIMAEAGQMSHGSYFCCYFHRLLMYRLLNSRLVLSAGALASPGADQSASWRMCGAAFERARLLPPFYRGGARRTTTSEDQWANARCKWQVENGLAKYFFSTDIRQVLLAQRPFGVCVCSLQFPLRWCLSPPQGTCGLCWWWPLGREFRGP